MSRYVLYYLGGERMFKDIKVIERNDGWHTIGWKFEYKGNKYGNVIGDQKPTGKFRIIKGCDEDGEYCEYQREI